MRDLGPEAPDGAESSAVTQGRAAPTVDQHPPCEPNKLSEFLSDCGEQLSEAVGAEIDRGLFPDLAILNGAR